MKYRNTLCWGVSALAIALAAPIAALAADAPPAAAAAAESATTTVEEVVVTVQKRTENVQTIPLSIVAVSEKQMESKGIRTRVP